MRYVCFIAVFALFGCAPKFTWYHPGLEPVLAERQYQIDSAECTVIAMRAVPTPQLSAPRQSLTVNVNLGDRGRSVGDAALEGAQAYETNADSIRQSQQYNEAESARSRFADACMLRRGWVKAERQRG